jgi:hypothetical protein
MLSEYIPIILMLWWRHLNEELKRIFENELKEWHNLLYLFTALAANGRENSRLGDRSAKIFVRGNF